MKKEVGMKGVFMDVCYVTLYACSCVFEKVDDRRGTMTHLAVCPHKPLCSCVVCPSGRVTLLLFTSYSSNSAGTAGFLGSPFYRWFCIRLIIEMVIGLLFFLLPSFFEV